MLKVKALKKYYGKNRGTDDVNLEIKPGEVFGLIGPNGAGKTTTIRCIMGLLKHYSGLIEIFDKTPSVSTFSKIGYLPSDVFMYEEQTVRDLLKDNAKLYEVENSYIDYLVDTFQLNQNLKFKELSTGNKKKVGILCALMHKPELLILDEPTNGLDPLMQMRLYDEIRKLKDAGNSILFSSHNLAEVERICDRVAIIKKGIVVETINVGEISKHSYKKIRIMRPDPSWKPNVPYDMFGDIMEIRITNLKLKSFMKELVNIKFDDIEILTPGVEDAFMEYYGDELG